MKLLHTLSENVAVKLFFQLILICIAFLPFLRIGAVAVYGLLCVLFGAFYIFSQTRQISSPFFSSRAFKQVFFFFYTFLVAGAALMTVIVYWENSALTLAVITLSMPLFYRSFFAHKNISRRIFFIAAIVIIEHLILFYFPEPIKEKDMERILQQKNVSPVFIFHNGGKPSFVKKILALPKSYGVIRTIYVDSREQNLYCILHGPPKPHVMAMKIPLRPLAFKLPAKTPFFSLDAKKTDIAGARDMAADEDHHRLYILGINGTVFVVNTNTFKIMKQFPTGAKRMMKLYLHKSRKNLLTLSESGILTDYSLPSWKIRKSASTDGNAYAILPDKKEKNLYIVQWGHSTVLKMNLKTLQISRELQIIGYYPVGADINEEDDELYFTDYFRGRLNIIDLRDFEIKKSIKIQRGLREARWDAQRKLLYMGNFQKGIFYVFDTTKEKVLKEIFLGKKLRHIYITPKTHQVLAATRYGVFKVDVDKLIGNITGTQSQ